MEKNTQQNQTGNGPGEVESDSGDSLFLTQKPVPKAVRSGRPPQRSTPTSSIFLDDSGSSSESEAEDVPGRRRKSQPFPKYMFPFLRQRKRGFSYFSPQSNKILHYYAMGGFFNCVRELHLLDKEGKSIESSLPTADKRTEEIMPLTEEEKSDEEDAKILNKKMFVYSLQPHRTKSLHLNQQKKNDFGEVTSKKDSAKNTVKRTLFTSKMHLDLQRKDLNQHHILDSSDSDATMIEGNIAQKVVSENLTEFQPSAGPVNHLCPMGELDDTQSQSILQNIPTESIENNTRKEKRRLKTKKKDEIDHQGKLTNGDIAENQESCVLLENYSTKSPAEVLHADNIPRKKTNKCIAENDSLQSQPDSIENGVNEQILNEAVGMLSSCLVETLNSNDSRLRKKKKKHKKNKGDQENILNETGTTLDPRVMVTNIQLDITENIQVHGEESELTDKRKRHKKKQKANSDDFIDQEDVSPKKHKKRLKGDEMSLSKSVESHEQSELVNLKSNTTDRITRQSDESVSVRKKKKRRGSFVDAETVENSNLPLSQSGDGDRADALAISTNETDSAENGGHCSLHEPVLELGKSAKKKKKKHNTGAFNNRLDNDNAIESTKILGKDKCASIESEECNRAKVAHPQSVECEQLKKKKKKKSKHESYHTEITVQQMSQREEGDSSIKSLKAFEAMKKKKRKHCDNDVDELEAAKTTELTTIKRKKHKKDRVEHDHPDVSPQPYVEMSPSSGSLVKNNSQTKVKKRLYNPNNNHLEEF